MFLVKVHLSLSILFAKYGYHDDGKRSQRWKRVQKRYMRSLESEGGVEEGNVWPSSCTWVSGKMEMRQY